MKHYGDIDLNNNNLLQSVIGTETNFPSSPIIGRLAFVNKILYICADVSGTGTPSWVPLTQEIDTYMYDQTTAAATWTVTHNLNTTNPIVQIYDTVNHVQMFPDEITITDNNTVTVTFNQAQQGRAIVMYGNLQGGARAQFAYEWTQSQSATTWVIPHNLGYYPVIRIFVGSQEIQPATITHDSIWQATVTFSSPQTGIARCA